MIDVYVLEHIIMHEASKIIGVYTSTLLAQEAAVKDFRELGLINQDFFDLGDWEREGDIDVAYLLLKQNNVPGWPEAGSKTEEWYTITSYELVGGAW